MCLLKHKTQKLVNIYCMYVFDFVPDTLKNRVSVGTLKFVLFLYIQQLHKVSLKASLVAGDEYPL